MTEKNITCEIVEPIAVLSENEKGYIKEINLVSWNGADPNGSIYTGTVLHFEKRLENEGCSIFISSLLFAVSIISA